MNTSSHKMEKIREVFLAAQVYCFGNKNLGSITSYCESIEKEFRSVAYEAASMQLALDDIEHENTFENWKHFADDIASRHATQVYVGLGWAIAKQTILLEPIIETLPVLLRYRVADGSGYYDGTFRNRQTVRSKQLPTYVNAKALSPYFQGVGRSIWYVSKGDAAKTKETIASFDKKNYTDLWRGVGIALAYVGGSDDATMKLLLQFSGEYKPQFACGIALAARSRSHAGYVTPDTDLCSRIVCGISAEDAAKITEESECDDYFEWLFKIESRIK